MHRTFRPSWRACPARCAWLAAASFGLLALAAEPQPPSRPERWEKDIQAFETADRENPPKPGGIVFVGSSSIRKWDTLQQDFPGHQVLNRGFGGSEMSDAVHFADRIVLPCKPRMVVVYAGDNDISRDETPARVAADFDALVKKIHRALPETRIGFIAIKPSLKRWELREPMQEANARIRRRCQQDARLVYLDVWKPMLGPDGTPREALFVKDGLHLSPEGYRVWREVVAPHLPPPGN